MATNRYTVTDVASVVVDAAGGPVNAKVANRGANPCFLGEEGVTATTGYELPAGEVYERRFGRREKLYAICAATLTTTLHVETDDPD